MEHKLLKHNLHCYQQLVVINLDLMAHQLEQLGIQVAAEVQEATVQIHQRMEDLEDLIQFLVQIIFGQAVAVARVGQASVEMVDQEVEVVAVPEVFLQARVALVELV